MGNHDQSRIASRLGRAQARIAMVLLLTLRGTPILYYGDELGLQDIAIAPEQAPRPFRAEHARSGPGTGLRAVPDALGRDREGRFHHRRSLATDRQQWAWLLGRRAAQGCVLDALDDAGAPRSAAARACPFARPLVGLVCRERSARLFSSAWTIRALPCCSISRTGSSACISPIFPRAGFYSRPTRGARTKRFIRISSSQRMRGWSSRCDRNSRSRSRRQFFFTKWIWP